MFSGREIVIDFKGDSIKKLFTITGENNATNLAVKYRSIKIELK